MKQQYRWEVQLILLSPIFNAYEKLEVFFNRLPQQQDAILSLNRCERQRVYSWRRRFSKKNGRKRRRNAVC